SASTPKYGSMTMQKPKSKGVLPAKEDKLMYEDILRLPTVPRGVIGDTQYPTMSIDRVQGLLKSENPLKTLVKKKRDPKAKKSVKKEKNSKKVQKWTKRNFTRQEQANRIGSDPGSSDDDGCTGKCRCCSEIVILKRSKSILERENLLITRDLAEEKAKSTNASKRAAQMDMAAQTEIDDGTIKKARPSDVGIPGSSKDHVSKKNLQRNTWTKEEDQEVLRLAELYMAIPGLMDKGTGASQALADFITQTKGMLYGRSGMQSHLSSLKKSNYEYSVMIQRAIAKREQIIEKMLKEARASDED
ncbi:hypothetical protein PENTCL1PPCAC_30277, partial [Pristionchus entomophagus]